MTVEYLVAGTHAWNKKYSGILSYAGDWRELRIAGPEKLQEALNIIGRDGWELFDLDDGMFIREKEE